MTSSSVSRLVPRLILLAAAAWTGALAHLVVVLAGAPALRSTAAVPVRRYAELALPTVLVVLATGILTALAEFRSLSSVLDTGYGRTLLVKSALVLGALCLALASRLFALRPNPGVDVPLLRRLTAPELALRLLGATGSYPSSLSRLIGALLLALGMLIWQIVRHRVEPLYRFTLVVRTVLVATMVGLYLTSRDPLFLVLAGIVGLGMVLTTMCDILIAADNARFSYPEVKVGFTGGIISNLASRIPHKIAMELLLLGEAIDARRAVGRLRRDAHRAVAAGCRRSAFRAAGDSPRARAAGAAGAGSRRLPAYRAPGIHGRTLHGGLVVTAGIPQAVWGLAVVGGLYPGPERC